MYRLLILRNNDQFHIKLTITDASSRQDSDVHTNILTVSTGTLSIYPWYTSYGIVNQPVDIGFYYFGGIAPYSLRIDFENDGVWDIDWSEFSYEGYFEREGIYRGINCNLLSI